MQVSLGGCNAGDKPENKLEKGKENLAYGILCQWSFAHLCLQMNERQHGFICKHKTQLRLMGRSGCRTNSNFDLMMVLEKVLQSVLRGT